MPFLALTGGAYTSRTLAVAAQSCINLMAEALPQGSGEPAPAAHQLTPGLRGLLTFPGGSAWRGLYRASIGTVYGVCGAQLVKVSDTLVVTSLGTLPSSTGPVGLSDNGQDLVVVDGSARGFTVLMSTGAFSEILDPAFYGGDRVACIDGFFVFNRFATNQFYLSNAISTTFNPLYIAAKASLDRLISLAVVERALWLFGETRTEIYTNTGAADFPLASMTGGIEYGCSAKHSVAQTDGSVFWLSRSRDGIGVVMQGRGYEGRRISTHAVEHAIQGYDVIADAVGLTYQLDGHTVYALTFPTADATWAYDLTTGLWHQWQSGDAHRHRGGCAARGAMKVLVGDYASGTLYALETDTRTDNGAPIRRVRAFPHIEKDGNRVFHRCVRIDMQTGSIDAGQPAPPLTLRWSDDGGQTFGLPVTVGMGANGAGTTSLQFRRLGYSRSRVYEVSWDTPAQTALLGAWLEADVAAT